MRKTINVLGAIVRKELVCLMRDKRILILILLLPLFLVPCLISIAKVATQPQTTNFSYHIAISDTLKLETDLLEENDFFEIEICSEGQAYEKLRTESIDVFLLHDENGTLKYLYNSASASSVNALSVVSKTIDDIQEHKMSLSLLERYDVPIEVSSSRTRSVYEDVYGNEYGSMIIMLIPMVVLAYSCYGVSCIAGEMTISECERGTFDPLLATGVKKSLLIFGKSFVSVLFGWLSGVLAFVGLYLFALIDGSNTLHITYSSVLSLSLVALLISTLFSALCILIGVSARSFKEYQAYSSVLSILSMIPTFFTMNTSAQSVPWHYNFVPLLNHTIAIKKIIADHADWSSLTIVILSTLIVSCVSSIFSYIMIQKRTV